MSDKTDLLILGATGFTGRLITRYLSVHPQRKSFTFAVGARSASKLQTLLEDLNLHKDRSIGRVQVDVTNEDDVVKAVTSTRVLINTVGPYWLWGTPVVKACAINGVHYVDLTGETVWMKKIIQEFDYIATKSAAVIVPSCGFDSIPSDAVAFLSNKTLKSLPTPLDAGKSVTAFDFKGGISGGTISSIMTSIEQVPIEQMRSSRQSYALSPIVGRPNPGPALSYRLPVPGGRPLVGSFFVMGPGNTALVQRTFGLLGLQARESPKSKQAQLASYGPEFTYDEFLLMPNAFKAFSFSVLIVTGFMLISAMSPLRWLLKKILPKSGEGPSDEEMQHGYFTSTNITTSSSEPPVHVKTVLKGKGDPGYLLTAIMISECALSFIIPPDSKRNAPQAARAALPSLAQRGGVLTPMTAFGDVLIQRLEASGRFEFSSTVVTDILKDD